MYEEEYQQIKDTLQRLQVDSNSKIVFLVDKNGQQIAVHGDMPDGRQRRRNRWTR